MRSEALAELREEHVKLKKGRAVTRSDCAALEREDQARPSSEEPGFVVKITP
jgi:hypothetical protein